MLPRAENPPPLLEIARAHERAGRTADAEAIYVRVLEQEPERADALLPLGLLALRHGRPRAALAWLRRAVAAAPGNATHHSALGRALQELGHADEAPAAHAIAVNLAPQDAEIRYRLGQWQWQTAHLDAAHDTLLLATRLDPAHAGAQRLLAAVLEDLGHLDEALARLRAMTASLPEADARIAHDMLVYLLHFHPDSTPASLQAEHAAWNERHAAALRKLILPQRNDRTPGRRLRIGYVSPDLRHHAVAFFILPLFTHHDATQFELYVYAGAAKSDQVTARFKAAAEVWRNVAGWSDEQLTESIRADGVDILVDLSLHMAKNRLLVFARKPAPIQVSWAAYPAGTGMDAIDYRITDRFLDPETRDDSLYAEKSIRLPDSYWCYEPMDDQPAVNALPALSRGCVTFGCLNKSSKINRGTVALWARVLQALPQSRLLLLAIPGGPRERVLALFREQAIAPDRLEFVGWQLRQDYLRTHHRIDIALDPIPYGGHTTLCDGLWMGVPTIALPGETPVSRGGLSLLTTAGLSDWSATSADDFVRIAVEKTRDLDGLAALRASLRTRMQASQLMDAARFTRAMESAYRAMWRTWCGAA